MQQNRSLNFKKLKATIQLLHKNQQIIKKISETKNSDVKLHTYLPKFRYWSLEFQKLMLKPWNHIIMQPGNENAGEKLEILLLLKNHPI